jgi:hypothetical protein
MEDGIKFLLEKYQKAFDTADAAAIADCYHEPCITIRGDGSFHLLEDRASTGRFLADVANSYRKEGMDSGKYSNLEILTMGTKCALATVDWQLLRSDGSVIRKWRQSYNVIDMDGTCRFYVSTFHV